MIRGTDGRERDSRASALSLPFPFYRSVANPNNLRLTGSIRGLRNNPGNSLGEPRSLISPRIPRAKKTSANYNVRSIRRLYRI